MNNKQELYSLINSLLEKNGFVRKKDDWFLESDECVSILGLGKSQWSGQYAIVLSVSVKAISNMKFPPPHKGHIHGFSLENIASNKKKLRDALNFEVRMPVEREKTIASAIEKKAIPFLKEISTIKGIKRSIVNVKDLEFHVLLKLREFLSTFKER
jgi:hypothetical protein